ncbi:putative efflux protein, MATE family [Bernardetia litoralis DSM 6794]|uniref:Multidrug-efflux transporter n=1 Tax=Bernardetia litoralis (strain ATCC 23117 / DSM 6794 / NBRC 15988 / NCIMB 1366 / Fx l1 / Sio-4) TaxID=880071 RepID=I4AF09_BERLS|nr:MATE family efflux transporter [Bernardetia litoralis]AFM02544.1 putative efflux protein, MATE family [Bernardetia litoralis DSM 6794]
MKNYLFYFKKHIRLSSPIVLGQITTVLIALSDTIMVGNYDTVALASSAFANSAIFTFATFGIGLTYGLKPPVANAYAAKNLSLCAKYLQNGMLLYALVSTLMWLGFEMAVPFLDYLDQPPSVVVLAIPYYRLVALSIIPWFLFLALQQFSEALTKTKVPMSVNILSCVVNIILNYLLIFGKFGFPELGLVGAGVATLVSRILMLLVMLIIFFGLPFFRQFIDFSVSIISKETLKKLLNIGVPIGMQMVFESGAFGVAAIMAGWISKEALAAHQIALNIAFTTFMVAVGISQGTTVAIANLVGKNNLKEIKITGRSAVYLIVVFMAVMGGLIFLFNEQIPLWYINEAELNAAEIVEITMQLLIIVAVFQMTDGIQVVSAGNLRGLEDIKVPTAISLFAYWVIGIGGGYVLAFPFGMGVTGIWWGLCLGLITSSILLTWRFESKKI